MTEYDNVPEDKLPFASAGEDDIINDVFDPFYAHERTNRVLRDSTRFDYPDAEEISFEGEYSSTLREDAPGLEELDYLDEILFREQENEIVPEDDQKSSEDEEDKILLRLLADENGDSQQLDLSPIRFRDRTGGIYGSLGFALAKGKGSAQQTLSPVDERFFDDLEMEEYEAKTDKK